MGKKLYVGNMSYTASENDLNQLFGQFGEVASARIITDRDSGRSKGFGFVEMGTDDGAAQAIEQLHGKEFMGRNLVVSEARDTGGGGGGGGGRGGRGGGGGGRGGFGGGPRGFGGGRGGNY